jgi:hypothetical protein
MPKMVWIKYKGEMIYVRAGSRATKNVHERWRILERELDHAPVIPMRVVSMLDFLREYGQDEYAYWKLEDLRDQVAEALAAFPRQRRIELLRQTQGAHPRRRPPTSQRLTS